jgi:hypothetical protein
MPLLITPWREEMYHDGKFVFTALITLICVFTKLFFKAEISWRHLENIEWLLVTYVLLVLLSTAFSIDRDASIWGQPRLREGMVSIFLYAAIFYLFYKESKISPKCVEAILMERRFC